MDLEHDDEKQVVRLLRALLKRLGRDHGVRCKAISAALVVFGD